MLLERDPDDVFLNFALAMEYAKENQHDEALAQFTRVTQLDRKYLPAYSQKADLLVSLNRHDEARQAFTEALVIAEEIGDKHAASSIRDALSLLG
jgi:Tfp pilus assembly protein PilF